MKFVSKIGKFYSMHKSIIKEEIEDSSISSNVEDNNMEKEVAKPNDIAVPTSIFQCIVLPQQDFPLFHSLGINKTFQINSVIQENRKLKSDNGVIQYTQKNNRPGYLLQVPSI
jgi:hypothetical protein